MALLEEKEYHRDQIGQLTRRYVLDVIQHERDREGRLKLPRSAQHRPTREQSLRELLLARGVPDYIVPRLVAEIVAGEKQEARKKRR